MGPIKEVLDQMMHAPICDEDNAVCYDWKDHRINNSVDAAKFLEKFMELFQERGDAESMESIELLIATKDHIFCTVGEAGVFEVGDFWSVGCGSPYALGALDVLWESLDVCGVGNPDDLPGIVEEAVRCACKYAAGCEPPVEILAV